MFCKSRFYFSIFDGDGDSCLRGWMETGRLLQDGVRTMLKLLRDRGRVGIKVVGMVGMDPMQLSGTRPYLMHFYNCVFVRLYYMHSILHQQVANDSLIICIIYPFTQTSPTLTIYPHIYHRPTQSFILSGSINE